MKNLFVAFFVITTIPVLAQTTRINFDAPGVYPEGTAFYPEGNVFFVSSTRTGTIGAVSAEGKYKVFYADSSLKSSFGMKVDGKQHKLWVCTGDPNYSQYSSVSTYQKLIRLISIDLRTGRKMDDIDLSELSPGRHFLNDLTLDNNGNVYLTDSFSPNIYKVDAKGHATVFAQSDLFKSVDIGLNGIAWNPKGFLIVVHNSNGKLYKVDLRDPKQITEVKVNTFFIGGDGLLWDNQGRLVVVQNKGVNKAYQLTSDDNWRSAQIAGATSAADRFKQPTTATMQGPNVYVLNSKLDELSHPTMPPSKEFSLQLAVFRPVK